MINFNSLLNQQSSEDTRSFIIHFPANSGKTDFAKRATAQHPDIYYLDIQGKFLEQDELPPISKFRLSYLKKYLLGIQVPQEFIIIDNSDFLFNTWKSEEKQAFIHWIKSELRSPADTKKTFIFFIQSDDILATSQLKNTYGQSRILSLNDFEEFKP